MGALTEWGIAAFTAFVTIGASYLVIHASRRDRAQDKHEKLEERVGNLESRTSALESAVQWIRTLFKQP